MSCTLTDEISNVRKPSHAVKPIFLKRWSPRAMTGESIPDEDLMSLFEAARWAPSAFNNQLWRFIYAKRDTEHWDKLFNLLGEFNQSWCKNAAALMVIITRDNSEFNEAPANTAQFDCGAAWENLALQGAAMDLVVHGMSGFDYDKAKKDLSIPDGYTVLAMAAVGKRAPKDSLPKELQDKESPSDRRPMAEIAFEGAFKK